MKTMGWSIGQVWRLAQPWTYPQIIQVLQCPCGSGLARECGRSLKMMVADTTPSRASPLPQGRAAPTKSAQ
ncbi:hypothetical protein C3E98_001860 [Pseudomonas sp. MWU13-2625]|nr:hypothetical protein C3E98_001860 [Pseudomonas sp. MWU13-2625]